MICNGVSGAEVARRFGLHENTVSKWRKAAGLSGTHNSAGNSTIDSTVKEEAMQLIRDGISGHEVAKQLGVHVNTVSRWRKAAGLSGTHKSAGNSTIDSTVKEEALQMVRDGVSGTEVAKQLGVSTHTVSKWRKEAGLSGVHNSAFDSTFKEEAMQMIRDGVSGTEVAKQLGVSTHTVSKWRKEAGLSGIKWSKKYSIENENDVIDLLREGKTHSEISSISGIGPKTIRKWKRRGEKEGFL